MRDEREAVRLRILAQIEVLVARLGGRSDPATRNALRGLADLRDRITPAPLAGRGRAGRAGQPPG